MKYHIISVLILTLYACIDTHDKSQNVLSNFKFPTNYSQKQVVSNEFPSRENAHPNAKRLMNEDFYWSPIDESAPFGSDDGADTYNGFATWRQRNKTEKPMVFFIAQIDSWGYPTFDFNETSFDKLEPYLSHKNPSFITSKNSGKIPITITTHSSNIYKKKYFQKYFNIEGNIFFSLWFYIYIKYRSLFFSV